MTIKLQHLIGGESLDNGDGRTFEIHSPADDSLVGIAPRGTSAEVDRAVKTAREAFATWSRMPAPARGEILMRSGRILETRKDEIAAVMGREMGKRLEEARGDIQEAIDTAYYAATEGRRLFGRTAPSELPNKFGMTIRRPIGVAGIITAWNFPIAVPSWKIYPALVCGNTVVWKPAEEAPCSGAMFAQALYDAGLPKGVLNVIHGLGEEAGASLVAHPNVSCLSFTGGTEVGKLIASEGGKTLKHISLELGGKNPVIVLEDADIDLAVDGILWGAFGTAGQRCTATSRLIAVGNVHERLLPKLIARAKELVLGDPADPKVNVGPLISKEHRDRVHSFVEKGRSEGAVMVTGGAIPTEGPLAKGWFYPATIADNVKRGSTLALREVFGPVLSVLRAKDLDEAIEIANEVEYGLSSSIYTANVNAAFRGIERIDAGITYVNAPTIGAEAHFPFGGVKGTGNGHREGGWAPYEFFSEVKTVYIDYSGGLQRAQIDNRLDD
ncbi:MAG: aldehyde dehydrogenase family protein [Deltaproteobacteria bacterium]|nr:aldehyde dehydrogenase family protein [Deltaproteobacteria bacterium]